MKFVDTAQQKPPEPVSSLLGTFQYLRPRRGSEPFGGWPDQSPETLKRNSTSTKLVYISLGTHPTTAGNGDKELEHFGSGTTGSKSFHTNGFPTARNSLSSHYFELHLRWINGCRWSSAPSFTLSFYSTSLVIFQMMTWDILSNLKQDYALLFKFPIRAPTIVYFISRSVSKLAVVSTTL